jgi:hypothetical protein
MRVAEAWDRVNRQQALAAQLTNSAALGVAYSLLKNLMETLAL